MVDGHCTGQVETRSQSPFSSALTRDHAAGRRPPAAAARPGRAGQAGEDPRTPRTLGPPPAGVPALARPPAGGGGYFPNVDFLKWFCAI